MSTKNKIFKTALFSSLIVLLISCSPSEVGNPINPDGPVPTPSPTGGSNESSFSVSSVSGTLASLPDQLTAQPLLAFQKKWSLSVFPDAMATAFCSGTAAEQSCSNGVQMVEYVGCYIPGTQLELNGKVTLTYSSAPNCLVSNDGDSVLETLLLNQEDYWGGTAYIHSLSHKDYRGNTIGGGTKLTQIDSTHWQLDVLGYQRINPYHYDVSFRTIAPIQYSNTLSRAGRKIDGGTLEVIHTPLKYTSTWTFQNLEYTAGCCHPVSGTATIQYSGTYTGSGKVTFVDCGKVLAHNDQTNEDSVLELNGCL